MTRVALVAALVSVAAPAAAQPAAVRLRSPVCPHVPFDPASVARLLGLELAGTGLALAEDAEVELAYELTPCARGETAFELVLRTRTVERRAPLSLAEVPLASVPRALALALAEEARDALHEAPPEAHPEADPAAEPGAEPEGAPEGAPGTASEAEPEPEAEPDVEADAAAGAEPAIRFGVAALARHTPDTGAALFGPRLFIDLPIADLPLFARVDVEVGIGPAGADLVLGSVGGGLTFGLRARASDVLALRFGPRAWLGSASWFDVPDVNRRTEVPVQVGLEVRVGLDVGLGAGVDLVVEASAGTHLHGLELERAGARSGLLGAYWGAEVGLAFH